MADLNVLAKDENLDAVNDFIHSLLEVHHFSSADLMQIDLCVEEIFVNIAHYAYASGTGEAEVSCTVEGNPPVATIVFSDTGVPFNPLAKEDPDITLSAEERRIGGLGIYLVKKYMESVSYERRDGKNVFSMKKRRGEALLTTEQNLGQNKAQN